jgi:hypothetical protein
MNVVRLVGVYNAEGTLLGEVSYWIGARFGRAHCSLCDITHGVFTERADWRACRATLPVPFVTFHLDDQPDTVRAALRGTAPAVVAEADDGTVVVLLGPTELEACAASPERLVQAIEQALTSSTTTPASARFMCCVPASQQHEPVRAGNAPRHAG